MKVTSMISVMVLSLSAAANASFIGGSTPIAEFTIPVTYGGTEDDPFTYAKTTTLDDTGYDVDFFSIYLNAGQTLTVTTTPMSTTTPMATKYTTPDTLLSVYTSAGVQEVMDDDSFTGSGSMVYYEAATSGTYYIGVTGKGDTDFNGYIDPANTTAHGISGKYVLGINLVPEPASLAILAVAGIGAMLRKRR
jgi:hypothetical protein